MIDLSAHRIWLTGFWGFTPETDGYLGFTDESDRKRFISETNNPQLCCIFGAGSEYTAPDDNARLLGALLVEHTEIDSWDRLSDSGKERNILNGGQNRWRFAMPARRAWRTKSNIRVADAFSTTYPAKKGQHLAKYGSWLTEKESEWLLTSVPFTECSVFGEQPVIDVREQKLAKVFRPSRDVPPGFGPRRFSVKDAKTHVYLAVLVGPYRAMFDGTVRTKDIVAKIGIARDLRARLVQLNSSFPPPSAVRWKIERHQIFQNFADAVERERSFKEEISNMDGIKSLGREFLSGDPEKIFNLFTRTTGASGLTISS